MEIKDWIQRLPKTEQHLHIEGTIPWSMVCASTGETLPSTPEWLQPDFRFDDFSNFSEAMSFGISRVITTVADYHRVARDYFQRLTAQNVRYVETSFAFAIAVNRGFAYADVLEAITSAAPESLVVRVFGAFHRGADFSDEFIQDALTLPGLTGIDVHGDERVGEVDIYMDVFDEARRRGLRTKAHAGELCDYTSVLDVLDKLRPQRIQHGITAAHHPDVLQRLAEAGVILDICPTSNVILRVVPDLPTYPIRQLVDAGVQFTVNTDDPGIFGCTLSGELLTLVEHDLLTLHEIAAMQRNAFRAADLPDATRDVLLHEIDALVAVLV